MRGVGFDARFIGADLEVVEGELPTFDRVYGQYALHHVNVASIAPILARHLREGGRGAFLETVATSPLFRLARRHLVGRFGIHRIGTLDEKPLGQVELETIRDAFGALSLELAEMQCLRIINRNLFLFRHETLNHVCEALDDALWRFAALHG